MIVTIIEKKNEDVKGQEVIFKGKTKSLSNFVFFLYYFLYFGLNQNIKRALFLALS